VHRLRDRLSWVSRTRQQVILRAEDPAAEEATSMLMLPKRRGEADLAEQAIPASVAGDDFPKEGPRAGGCSGAGAGSEGDLASSAGGCEHLWCW
jgi:hypothetical protein